MAVLDEEGRLFGVVNVVDLFVVLVALVLVAGGIAIVLTSGTNQSESPTVTRYATLAITDEAGTFDTEIQEGETLRQGRNLTVTDTYTAPTRDGTMTIVRARYTRPAAGMPRLRAGQRTVFTHGDVQVRGRLLAVNETDGDSLPVETTAVTLETDAPPPVLDSLRTGDALRLDGQQVASVASVTVYPRSDGEQRRAVVGARLSTIERNGRPFYGNQSLTNGTQLRFRTNRTTLNAVVTNVGNTEPRGEPVEATVEVVWRDVPPTVADQLVEGATEQHRGATATLVNVTSQPATVLATTQDGQVREQDHPRNRDLRLTLSVTARQTADEVWFHGQPLQIGSDVRLDFARVDVDGHVVDFQITDNTQ
jgi:hypothetical protein